MPVAAVPHEVTVCTVARQQVDLDRFLEAMDEQSLPVPGYDVVVVDASAGGDLDGSKARRCSVELVRAKPDETPGAMLNLAWRAARGTGVGFVAADVVALPMWVEHLARSLVRGRPLVTGRWLPNPDTLRDAGPLSFRLWAVQEEAPLVSTAQLGCRRADLEAIGGFDETIADPRRCDMDLAIRLVESGVDPRFNRHLICQYDVARTDLSSMITARSLAVTDVRMAADRPAARARLLAAGVIRNGAAPQALLAVAGLVLSTRDRRAALLIAPWWHTRTCVVPHAGGPRRKRLVLPGVLAFDVYDAVLGLAVRLRPRARR